MNRHSGKPLYLSTFKGGRTAAHMAADRDQLAALILCRLARRGCWGGRHTAVEHVSKGIPKHLRGEVADVLADLVKRGYILTKPTSYGLQVALNPVLGEEIKAITQRLTKKPI